MGCKTINLKCSKTLGIKGEIQTSQKFTDPFVRSSFVDDLEPHDSLGLQLNLSVLRFVTWVGYEVASDCVEVFAGGKLHQQSQLG